MDLKQCSKCGEWKPATTEYFYKDKIGLRAKCKKCLAEYKRQYKKNNRDKVNEWDRRYAKAHPDKVKGRHQRYREKHPVSSEKSRERLQQWADAHPEKESERHRRWHAAHPEKTKESIQQWRNTHPEKLRDYSRRRRTRKLSFPVDFTATDEIRALEYWYGLCAYCGDPVCDLFGDKSLHFDHFIPLSDKRPDNPGTVSTNMLPTCSKCNTSKNDSDPVDWLTRKFGKRKAAQIIQRIETYFEYIKEQCEQ